MISRSQGLSGASLREEEIGLWERVCGEEGTLYQYQEKLHTKVTDVTASHKKKYLRWLDWIVLGGYLPRLSINYVAMSKDMGKRLPQLYYIKMKISYDLGFIAIGVAIAT